MLSPLGVAGGDDTLVVNPAGGRRYGRVFGEVGRLVGISLVLVSVLAKTLTQGALRSTTTTSWPGVTSAMGVVLASAAL